MYIDNYAIKIENNDNVATLLVNCNKDMKINIISLKNSETSIISAYEFIPMGHKISLCNVNANSCIIKYGQVIGKAKQYIYLGSHVHVHNIINIHASGKL